MGSAVSDGRLKAVKTAARLTESTTMKGIDIESAKKVDNARSQAKVNHIISNKLIASAEMDREVRGQALAVQRGALDKQRQHSAAQLQRTEIFNLMRLDVSAGDMPAEARRLARKDVRGE
jgi:hypothetical protein